MCDCQFTATLLTPRINLLSYARNIRDIHIMAKFTAAPPVFGAPLRFALLSAGAAIVLWGCGGGGSGGSGGTTSPTPAPNQAPVFSSAANASVEENSTDPFYTVTANDPDSSAAPTIELLSTGDGALFTLNASTNAVSATAPLDFETPSDGNADNIYDLTFTARDGAGGSTQLNVAVTVEDVSDTALFGLNPNVPPSGNFDLLDWKMDLPINDDGGFDGIGQTISENDMADGYENSDYFFTGPDGGMVMRVPPRGAKTSANTQYTRTELREMLRRGDRSISTRGAGGRPNKNNWAFSSAPQSALDDAGGIDGQLNVTMAVNSVTTTGENFQIGRLIIGQIHAKDDEPIRLYYRKLPGNVHGSIYAQHERIGQDDDVNFNIIGSSSSSASDPADGFELGEIFSYEIRAEGNFLFVTITQDGVERGSTEIDMTGSGYDVDDDFMYFKVGAYHVNNSADDGEFAQVTIYELENTHEGYPF